MTFYVSCLMPTYNRYPHSSYLVEEAVECFLRQTYPSAYRELLILNDCEGQVLQIHPSYSNVRVINTSRFSSLGEKRNALTSLCRGDILLPWDDDDISLPHRIQQAVHSLGGWESYWNPRHYWWLPNGDIRQKPLVPGSLGYAHNCSAFHRGAFYLAGGYPFSSGNEDMVMDKRLRQNVPTRDGLNGLAYSEWPYIYRWGVSPHHLSGRADLDNHYREIGEKAVMRGTFEIQPRWQRDYVQAVSQEVETLLCSGATE